jgi:acid phosphatase (class A)
MRKNSLEYDEDVVEYIEEQCSPIIRHYKNHFNRPRPYQVADLYNKELNRFKTGTAKTPSYPSGHACQPMVVALHYAKKYPEHKNELVRGAKICGYGRVVAGLHYPSDYDAGIELAHKLMDFMNYDKF